MRVTSRVRGRTFCVIVSAVPPTIYPRGTTHMAGKQPARSVTEIEADLTATRNRMSRTVDELAYRVSPDTLKANAIASLKGKANDAAFDADGNPRLDRLAVVLGGVAGTAILLGLLRRAFHRG
ncbi:DUF3618 domain-containing protein [Ornithinimicrobium avium]|uniref:DUF3618 domain-containing protein n=1 Tax=Ornithinimicrobium avium TaxID=2283195 RepID=A0A345NLX7_9MICO|nr:DUF3618 domain-containing protein [Ornithinimicrobium avium]